MDVREKLVELLCSNSLHRDGVTMYDVADHLIANGVIFKNCNLIRTIEQSYKNGYENGQNKWISVKDRLPETDEKVLCYKKGEIKIGKYLNAKYTDEIYAFRSLDMTMAFGATHWMPLPKPPKGE